MKRTFMYEDIELIVVDFNVTKKRGYKAHVKCLYKAGLLRPLTCDYYRTIKSCKEESINLLKSKELSYIKNLILNLILNGY